MEKLNELGKRYFLRIKDSIYPEAEIDEILNEIDNLTYSENNKPISDSDKEKLVSVIIESLKGDLTRKKIRPLLEHREIEKAYSNDNYLDLIEYIKNQTKGK